MDKNNDARFEAMMEHYRNEMLRYQRATPPGEETLTEKRERAEKKSAGTCHSCMTAESAPKVKTRPLPPEEESPPAPARETAPEAECPQGEESSPETQCSPKQQCATEDPPAAAQECAQVLDSPASDNVPEAVEAAGIPMRWRIFFPDLPRPRPVPPMPRPNVQRPQPPRPQMPGHQPQGPQPHPERPQMQPRPQRPQMPQTQPTRPDLPYRPQIDQPQRFEPQNPQPLIPTMQAAAADAADRLLDTRQSDFDTLVGTLAEKFDSLDDGTLTRVLSVISRNDPDLAAAVSKAMQR